MLPITANGRKPNKKERMMRKLLISILLIGICSGCAYNSQNLFDLHGKNMTFTKGLIAVKNVNRVIIYRATNSGKGNAPAPMPGVLAEIAECTSVNREVDD